MLFVYYPAVILVFKRFFAVLPLYLLYNLCNEFFLYGAFTQNIIGRNAGLTAVEIFSEYDSFSGKLYVCA